MAWTATVTHATGDVLPASDWNTYVRDNLNYLHGDAGVVNINNSLIVAGYLEAVNTAGSLLFEGAVTGEANPRVQIDSTNTARIAFGPGGATAVDTQLYRNAAGVLRTAGSFIADLAVSGAGAAGANPIQAYVTGEANPRSALSTANGGSLWFGPGGATALDTQLYRNAAGVLRTPGSIVIDGTTTLTGAVTRGNIEYAAYASWSGGAPATVTPDSTIGGDVQRYNVTVAGTLTIAAPALTPPAGQSRFLTIIIHNAAGTAVTNSWNAVYTGTPLGSTSAGLTAYNFFVYNPGEAKYQCLLANMN